MIYISISSISNVNNKKKLLCYKFYTNIYYKYNITLIIKYIL